jgi:predicted nucleic acid-binding protein
MRIILDTGAMFHPEVLRRTLQSKAPVVLPAVAYAERRRQLRAAGRSLDEFSTLLAAALIDVEPFTRAEADRLPHMGDEPWRRMARDALIAAHVQAGDELWTTNPKDFLLLGVPRQQVVQVP